MLRFYAECVHLGASSVHLGCAGVLNVALPLVSCGLHGARRPLCGAS